MVEVTPRVGVRRRPAGDHRSRSRHRRRTTSCCRTVATPRCWGHHATPDEDRATTRLRSTRRRSTVPKPRSVSRRSICSRAPTRQGTTSSAVGGHADTWVAITVTSSGQMSCGCREHCNRCAAVNRASSGRCRVEGSTTRQRAVSQPAPGCSVGATSAQVAAAGCAWIVPARSSAMRSARTVW